MADAPLSAEQIDACYTQAMAMCATHEECILMERVFLAAKGEIVAAAREAELAGALERLIGEIEAYMKDAPIDDVGLLESVCDRAKAALASPSRGAEGYRLAKALADFVMPDGLLDCAVCAVEAELGSAGDCLVLDMPCPLAAYRAHEEASRD